jgi:hypothetical protein
MDFVMVIYGSEFAARVFIIGKFIAPIFLPKAGSAAFFHPTGWDYI